MGKIKIWKMLKKYEESTFENEKQGKLKGMIGGKDIIHLKTNFIPK